MYLTAHAVQHEVTFGGRGFQDSLQERDWLLRWVANPVFRLRIDWRNILPEILSFNTVHVIEVLLQRRSPATLFGPKDSSHIIETVQRLLDTRWSWISEQWAQISWYCPVPAGLIWINTSPGLT